MKDEYRIESYTAQAVTRSVWFKGTKEECEHILPRIKRFADNTSDEFKIVKA
jgi:hypothetical protein